MRVVAIFLACSACTIAEKQVAADLACAELPLPATADEQVTISGVVKSLQGTPQGAGIVVQGFSSDLPLDPVTTDDGGSFEYTHETAGVPNIVSVLITTPGFVPTISYGGLPVSTDATVDARIISEADALAFMNTTGIIIDPTKGLILLRVTDCNESPIAGGTVTAEPAGETYYFRLAAPDLTATDTDASGIVMIANLPPGEITLSGSAGVELRSHKVTVTPDAFVLTLMEP